MKPTKEELVKLHNTFPMTFGTSNLKRANLEQRKKMLADARQKQKLIDLLKEDMTCNECQDNLELTRTEIQNLWWKIKVEFNQLNKLSQLPPLHNERSYYGK